MNGQWRADDLLSDLGNAVRENPVSAALIGMGVLWMIAGGRSSKLGSLLGDLPDAASGTFDAASRGLRSTLSRASDGVSGAGNAVGSATSAALAQVADVGGKIADQASHRFSGLPDAGREMFGTARSGLSDLFEAQPLALGVIGLGIGASIAAALPPTEIERTYLGETSDRLKSQSTEFIGEKVDQVVQTAQDVVGAMAAEAEKQGLTPDGLQSAVGEVSQKVSRVVDSAMSQAKSQPAGRPPGTT